VTQEFAAAAAAAAPAAFTASGSHFVAFRDPKTHPVPPGRAGGLPRPPSPGGSAASRWLADSAASPPLGGVAAGGLPQEVSSTVICDLGEMDALSPRIPQARPLAPHVPHPLPTPAGANETPLRPPNPCFSSVSQGKDRRPVGEARRRLQSLSCASRTACIPPH
jgi:hypothetical protein